MAIEAKIFFVAVECHNNIGAVGGGSFAAASGGNFGAASSGGVAAARAGSSDNASMKEPVVLLSKLTSQVNKHNCHYN